MKRWGWGETRGKEVKIEYPKELETLHKFSKIVAKFLLYWALYSCSHYLRSH